MLLIFLSSTIARLQIGYLKWPTPKFVLKGIKNPFTIWSKSKLM